MGPIEAQMRQATAERRARLKGIPKRQEPEPSDRGNVFELRLERQIRNALRVIDGLTVTWDRRPTEQPLLRVRDIIAETAAFYELSADDLLANRRTWVVTRPRQIAMYLATKMTTRSLPFIGRAFGGRDHTTVLHASRSVGTWIKTDELMRDDVQLLTMRLLDKFSAPKCSALVGAPNRISPDPRRIAWAGDQNAILQKMADDGMTAEAMARELRTSSSTIRRRLHDSGIRPTRARHR